MAICNFVFDLGNVLVDYDPYAYLKSLGYEGETAARLMHTVFEEFWPRGDRGDFLSVAELRDALVKAFPDDADDIRRILVDDCVKMHVLRGDVGDYLLDLKARGYRIYILSNLAKYSYEYIIRYPLIQEVDGGIFSYQEGVCKPEKAIYNILLERYQLVPAQTIFFDDNADNIAAAKSLGIHGIRFRDLNQAKTEAEALLTTIDSEEPL